MSEVVDVFWSFRSPYSYLAGSDMLALARDFEVDVALRVVLPLAVREPDFYQRASADWVNYIAMDWRRRAEFLGLTHGRPDPDPVVIEPETRRVATEQPMIHWLSALGVEAQRRGRGPAFAAAVSAEIFGGTQNWHRGLHLADAAARAGLHLEDMWDAIEDGDHEAEIDANHAALTAAGHWGVPTFLVRGEPFFGQDRVDTLRWRLDQLGVARRDAVAL